MRNNNTKQKDRNLESFKLPYTYHFFLTLPYSSKIFFCNTLHQKVTWDKTKKTSELFLRPQLNEISEHKSHHTEKKKFPTATAINLSIYTTNNVHVIQFIFTLCSQATESRISHHRDVTLVASGVTKKPYNNLQYTTRILKMVLTPQNNFLPRVPSTFPVFLSSKFLWKPQLGAWRA